MDGVHLLLLGLKGLLVACIPLAMVWATRGTDKLRRLAWVTVFFTFDLIVFGAFTRLTDSGLGCPDWPGCYAKANPIAALSDIRAAEALLPGGPVTVMKAWIEMLHRYFAMGVGLLIVVMMVLSWWRVLRLPANYAGKISRPWLATGLFGLVCLQGAFGAWTVTLKLQPAIVTIHLLLGMLLLALLAWQAVRLDAQAMAATFGKSAPVAPAGVVPSLRWLAVFSLVLLALQIALGGWVSTNYAVLACTEFPMCQGVLVPEMDFRNGFDVWRELGRTSVRGAEPGAVAGYLPFAALTAIHWVHRNVAFVVFAVLGWLAWRGARIPALHKLSRALGILLVAQFLTGIANVVFSWPLLAGVLHNAGAAAMVLVLVMLNYRTAHLAQVSPRPPLHS